MRPTFVRCAASFAALFALALVPASVSAQDQAVAGSGLLLYSHAPTIEFDGDSYAGASLSAAGELVLQSRWVGRVQVDILQASSLSGPDAERVTGGLAFIGSLGYRFRLAGLPRFSLDLLGHAGYAQVTYNNGNADFTEASPQFGVGVAPHVAVTERLGVTLSLRMLQGTAVGEGSAINRTDVGVGARLRLF